MQIKNILLDIDLGNTLPKDVTALVKNVEIKEAKTGSKYIDVLLTDKTGEIKLRKWNCEDDDLITLTIGKVINVQNAEVNIYKNDVMLVVRSADNFSIAKDENENDYILTVIPDTEEIIAKLRAHIVGIKNKHLKGMCIDVLKRDGLFDKFSVHPAAESKHHAEKHGLLYHECRMMDAAAALCDVYGPDIDKDVVITAILFHDIGKLLELDASPSGAGVYTKYAMLGHIFIGANMVSEYHSAGMITDEEWMQVSHCILAHHGTKEWGSPVEPMTKEALLVHHVDNLDAKMFTMENVDLHMEPGEFTSRAYAYGGKYAYKPLALNQMPKESAGEK